MALPDASIDLLIGYPRGAGLLRGLPAVRNAFLALEPNVIPLQFLPWGGRGPVNAAYPVLRCDSPREMAAAMASTRLVISGDTGPMHLASATTVPTIALFRVTNPNKYGPLKPCDASVN